MKLNKLVVINQVVKRNIILKALHAITFNAILLQEVGATRKNISALFIHPTASHVHSCKTVDVLIERFTAKGATSWDQLRKYGDEYLHKNNNLSLAEKQKISRAHHALINRLENDTKNHKLHPFNKEVQLLNLQMQDMDEFFRHVFKDHPTFGSDESLYTKSNILNGGLAVGIAAMSLGLGYYWWANPKIIVQPIKIETDTEVFSSAPLKELISSLEIKGRYPQTVDFLKSIATSNVAEKKITMSPEMMEDIYKYLSDTYGIEIKSQ